MAGSEVATTLILFTGAMALAAVTTGYLSVAAQDVAQAGESVGHSLAEELRTGVRIVNDPATIPTSPVRFYLKNTGTESLRPNETRVLVDGVPRTNATYSVLNASASDLWRTGEMLEVRDTTLTLSVGDHTVTAVVGRGVSHTIRIRI